MTGRWLHNKTLFRQGAYLLCGDDGREIAAIVAADDTRPLHALDPNAQLLLRECDTNNWRTAGRFTLVEAIQRASRHAESCRAQGCSVSGALLPAPPLPKPGP